MNARSIRLIGLLVLTVLFVSGCAGTPAPASVAPTTAAAPAAQPTAGAAAAQPTAAAPAAAGQVTINYWHVWAAAALPPIDKQIADFEAKNPNIKVKATSISQTDMTAKYMSAIAGGDPPDIIMIHGARDFPAFADNGALVQLDDMLKQDNIDPKKVWFDNEYNTYLYDGKTYALPYATGSGFFFLFWNKDQFKAAGLDPDKPPKNWSEYLDYSKKLTKKNDKGEFTQIGGDPAVGGAASNYLFREYLFLNGGNIMSPDRKKVLFDSPEGLQTLQWLTNYYKDVYGGFDKVQSIVGGTGSAPFRDAFLTRKLSMLVDGIWVVATAKAQQADLNFGMALVPYNDKNPKAAYRNINEGGWGYAIPKGSKHVKEAWQFLKWTTMDQGNLDFFKSQLRASPVIAYQTDPFFAKEFTYWNVIQEAIQKTEYSPSTPVAGKLNDITLQMTQEALLGKKTPEEAIKWAATESQKALDAFWAQRK
jgi:multiple sugar transport system substrate-binding protein